MEVPILRFQVSGKRKIEAETCWSEAAAGNTETRNLTPGTCMAPDTIVAWPDPDSPIHNGEEIVLGI
jgi:hypothetical protein